MQLIDTHSHLNFKAYNSDRDEIIKKCLAHNVWLINASSTFNTSKLSVEIAEKYKEGIYASVGLHPIHVTEEEFDKAKYQELAKSNKVVAIGETGLDYMYPDHKKQKTVFLKHLDLAKKLDLPVIFHCRKAHNALIEILKARCGQDRRAEQGGRSGLRGVVHCFSGRWSDAKKYLDMGLYLGFNGIIYKLDLDEAIKKTPLDRILIETDCPYLTPPEAIAAGEAKAERNEPIFVKYIAQHIAQIKNESLENTAEATTENAEKLFNLTKRVKNL